MVPTMRTLNVGLRVTDLEQSLAFYRAVGYAVVGTVEGTAFGSLTMLQLPGDPFAAEPAGLPGGPDGPRTGWITDPDGYRIELVQWPAGHADGMTSADFA
jgi:lactoylglutathione lyase